jgi:hypothetical protein
MASTPNTATAQLFRVDGESDFTDVVRVFTEAFGNQLTHILAGLFIGREFLGVKTLVTEFNEIHF